MRPELSMPMSALTHQRSPPHRTRGRRQAARPACALELPEHTRTAALSRGGIATTLSLDGWPRLEGVHWRIPVGAAARADMTPREILDFGFIAVLRSVDALLTKAGDGCFVEATCNGTPTLFAPCENRAKSPSLAY